MITMVVMWTFFGHAGAGALILMVPGLILLVAGILAFSSLRRCACFLAGVVLAAVCADIAVIVSMSTINMSGTRSVGAGVVIAMIIVGFGVAGAPVGLIVGILLAKRFLPKPFFPRMTDGFRTRIFAPALVLTGAACTGFAVVMAALE